MIVTLHAFQGRNDFVHPVARKLPILILAILPGLWQSTSAGEKEENGSDRQVFSGLAFWYWNDNFLFEQFISGIIPPGSDDHVTAAFRLEYLRGSDRWQWDFNLFFNILTNKRQRYRSDLLTLLLIQRFDSSLLKLGFGLGVTCKGNWWGSRLQNAYHRMFHYSRIEFPYLPVEKGLLACFTTTTRLGQYRHFHFTGKEQLFYAFATGPSKVWTGLAGAYQKKFKQNHLFSFQIDAGYVYYYGHEEWEKPLFGRGFSCQISTAVGFGHSIQFRIGLSRGQYGMVDEFHFGFAFLVTKSRVYPPLWIAYP